MIMTCVDACCLLNLIRGDFVSAVVVSATRSLCCQGLVIDEIVSDAPALARLIRSGALTEISGGQIFSSQLGAMAAAHNIGLGEAECIVIAKDLACSLASDDKRARTAAVAELGKARVTGSIGLIREAVAGGVVELDDAYLAYSKMINAGAYLPNLAQDKFEELVRPQSR